MVFGRRKGNGVNPIEIHSGKWVSLVRYLPKTNILRRKIIGRPKLINHGKQ
jgi:hypothetical protein